MAPATGADRGRGYILAMHLRPAFFAPLLIAACGLLSLQVDKTVTTTIAGGGLVGELLGTLDFTGLDSVDVDIEQELADQGAEPGDLSSVTVSELSLTASPDLSFLDSIHVYVSGDGVDEVEVASATSFPEGESTVELTTTGADFKDAVIAGGLTFRVDASGTQPTDDTDVDVHVVVDLVATPQGACNAASRDSG